MVLDIEVELLGFLGAKVADGAVNQLQTGLNGALADVLDVGALVYALDLRVGTEFQIDLIGVVDQLLREILAYQVGQLDADLIGQRKPVVMAQVGLQLTQTPVLSLGQCRFSTGLPFSTSRILWGVLLLRSSSSAVKMPAGPAPTMIRSYMGGGSLL